MANQSRSQTIDLTLFHHRPPVPQHCLPLEAVLYDPACEVAAHVRQMESCSTMALHGSSAVFVAQLAQEGDFVEQHLQVAH
jgi:hypothetical protein